mmetsp:Transcript_24918/g.62796  ORF Transcript_24918/g.62796 Transcript_24918/m.62796 type:complete len:82 (+) Transcript_24918:953-1198(+)
MAGDDEIDVEEEAFELREWRKKKTKASPLQVKNSCTEPVRTSEELPTDRQLHICTSGDTEHEDVAKKAEQGRGKGRRKRRL